MDPDVLNVVVGLLTGSAGFFAGQLRERRNYRLSATAFVSDYFRDLRGWASDAVEVLTEAAYHAPGRSDTSDMDPAIRKRCRRRLSALVDRGRFFIPNAKPEQGPAKKPAAYRGIRPPALDVLIVAEQILGGSADVLEKFPSPRAALVEAKRYYVSEIQELLDPRAQNRELAHLLTQMGMVDADGRCAIERLAQAAHEDFSRVPLTPTR